MKAKTKNTLWAPLLTAVILILMVVMRAVDPSLLTAGADLCLTIIVLQLFIFILPGLFYTKLRASSLRDRMNLRLFGLGKLPFVLLAFLVLLSGTLLLKAGLYYLLGTDAASYAVSAYDSYFAGAQANPLYLAVAVALIPAFTEEFVFRSVLLTEYADCGVFCSVVMTSLLFATIHFDLRQFPVYFFAGVVLGVTALVTRSVAASFLVHLLNNLFSLFFDGYLSNLIKNPDNLVFLIFVMGALLLVSLYLMFGSAERLYYTAGVNNDETPPEAAKKEEEKEEGGDKPSGRFFEALFSPSFLLCLLIYITACLVQF